MNPAIVYLAQNTSQDSQHRRQSRQLLTCSLQYLFAFYNAKFQHDVVIFHEGDFSLREQREIAAGRPIRFELLQFELPDADYESPVSPRWYERGASHYHWTLGHRHMCRFYGITIWRKLDALGYDWVMRFDDDSFMLSAVDYDMFQFAAAQGYRYGYRVDCWEPASLSEGFHEFIAGYARANSIPASLYWRWSQSRPPHFRGFYNNWFLSDVSWWLSDPVTSFLRAVDRTGFVYTRRWNDLIIQAAAVQLFMRPSELYKFTDWTYQHASTNRDNSLGWGGVFIGSNDPACVYAGHFAKQNGRILANRMTF